MIDMLGIQFKSNARLAVFICVMWFMHFMMFTAICGIFTHDFGEMALGGAIAASAVMMLYAMIHALLAALTWAVEK